MSFSYTKTTGSMSEMQQLEDDFVSGNWVPPFLREAPTKKRGKYINSQLRHQKEKRQLA